MYNNARVLAILKCLKANCKYFIVSSVLLFIKSRRILVTITKKGKRKTLWTKFLESEYCCWR